MARPPLQLVIGNYNTSSWSLRASLVVRLARLAFIETRIPLRRPETAERIARFSPSGKLPVLVVEGVPVWDSLAIAEFVAELEPSIWPIDPVRRAEARAISAEMHSGFADLRRLMPMDIVSRFGPPGKLPRGLATDIARIMAIWRSCRERHAADGPFLFGAFSVADAMMAPVASRLVTHGVPLEGVIEDYVDSVMAWPDMVAWCDAAAAEQDERARHGSLGVIDTLCRGRVLNGNGGHGEAAATPPAAVAGTAGETPAEVRSPDMAPTAPEPPEPGPVPADETAAATKAATTGPEQQDAPGREVAAASSPAEPGEAAADATPAHAEAEAPDEPPALAEPKAPDAQSAAGESGQEATTPPSLPLEHEGLSERAPAAGARRLGWIRRPVPPEHLAEVEEDARPSHPLRRATFGQVGHDRPGKAEEKPEQRPDPAAEHRTGAEEEARRASKQQRDAPAAPDQDRPGSSQDAGNSPPAPAVKPIGGGIHRRR